MCPLHRNKGVLKLNWIDLSFYQGIIMTRMSFLAFFYQLKKLLILSFMGCLLSLLINDLKINVFASETSTYDFQWLDPDKEVYVLQNRKYRKNGKLNLSLGGGLTTTGSFVDSTAYQGRVGYFFREDWGIELIYAKLTGRENDTAKSVRSEGASGSTPFRRIVQNYMGGMAIWSPFYSKVNTFNAILYYDWFLGLGMAKIEEKNNRQEFINGSLGNNPQSVETHTGVMWGTGFKFYLSEMWDIRLDLLGIHAEANKASVRSNEKVYFEHYDLTLALGLRF